LLLLSSIFNKEFPVGIRLLYDNLISCAPLIGLIAEDGQLYIMDPQGIDSSERGHSDQLNALQALKQTVLEHHKRFTEFPVGIRLLYDNLISCAPLIFCTTKPCCLVLNLSKNVIFL
jgi:hypothetical protein